MSNTRTCKRCQGEEFLMTTESGVVIQWKDAGGTHNTWFCPRCDWERPTSVERDA